MALGLITSLVGTIQISAGQTESLALPVVPRKESAPPAAVWSSDADLIVRVFYGDRERLAWLASRYDVFEYANHEEGYVAARLRDAEYRELVGSGYRVELDNALTATANTRLHQGRSQSGGIPTYPCYRTVEETQAALTRIAVEYPNLAALVDIGDSWEKTISGGQRGYDLLVLALSNWARSGPKPRFFLMAEHHARELVTAETATRFAEELASRYDTDPDVTWLLDYCEIHVLPMANPDGRKWAEQGYWWRKNTDDTNGCTVFPSYGTDLNRNCEFKWGGIGSSTNACNEVYRGPTPFSEPENQAIRDYVVSLFPDQRGALDGDAAPPNTTGLVISLHSYGQLVLFPWGWSADISPNHSELQTLGGKFGFFNRATVQPSNRLYPTTGTVDDWAYGELGVAAFTFEMGTNFFESCAAFEQQIYPSNRLALYYAAKACRQPYLDPAGPDVVEVSVAPSIAVVGTRAILRATAEGPRSFGTTSQAQPRMLIASRYTVDAPSWMPGVSSHPLAPVDGAFDSPTEDIQATIDTITWAPGRHTIFVESQNNEGRWGVPTAVFLWIEPLTITGTVGADGFVLQWPSVLNRSYTVLRAEGVGMPFSVLATDLPADPPTNHFIDTIGPEEARFYQVRMDR